MGFSDRRVRSDDQVWCRETSCTAAVLHFSVLYKPTCSGRATLTSTNICQSMHMHVLTFSLDFVCAPSPDNSPGLQLDLKSPSFWPLGLLRVKQREHCSQLQVSVQVVHLGVVVHPRNGSVGKEARGSSHVHFPCLLSVSSQNNLLCPGLDRDAYSRRTGGGNPWNNNYPVGFLHVNVTHFTVVESRRCQTTRVFIYLLTKSVNWGINPRVNLNAKVFCKV